MQEDAPSGLGWQTEFSWGVPATAEDWYGLFKPRWLGLWLCALLSALTSQWYHRDKTGHADMDTILAICPFLPAPLTLLHPVNTTIPLFPLSFNVIMPEYTLSLHLHLQLLPLPSFYQSASSCFALSLISSFSCVLVSWSAVTSVIQECLWVASMLSSDLAFNLVPCVSFSSFVSPSIVHQQPRWQWAASSTLMTSRRL